MQTFNQNNMQTFNQNNMQTVERELSWNDTIIQDSAPIVELKEGDYLFNVKKIEKARTKGSAKLPPCNMAKITFNIIDPLTGNHLKEMSYAVILHSRLEWKISEFFVGIGLKQKGAPLVMDWNNAIGKTGVCAIAKKEHEGKFYDEVKLIYDPQEGQKRLGALHQQTPIQTTDISGVNW